MPGHFYIARSPAGIDYGVWRDAGYEQANQLAAGLDRKTALSMRDRLNDQARRATSIAPPHAR